VVAPGTLVTELVPFLVDRYRVTGTGSLLEFEVPGGVRARIRSPRVRAAVAAALSRRAVTDPPVWDSLVANLEPERAHERAEILEHVGFHQPLARVARATTFPLTRGGAAEAIRRRLGNPAAGTVLAWSSRLDRVAPDGPLHVPMLDFQVAVSPAATELATALLAELGVGGWLLSSGHSYHFIGDEPLAGAGELAAFLGRALLFAPVVDGRWVAHQLIEGACALRISTGDRDRPAPVVVAEVG
jgi:hypothetical protein